MVAALIALFLLAVFTVAALVWSRRRPAPAPAPPLRVPPAWLAALTAGELAELCLRLLSRLGYGMLAQTVVGERADVTAVGSGPHTQRLLLRAFPHAAGPVSPERLQLAVEQAHREAVNRVLVVGVAGFTEEAQREAQAMPVDLLDALALDALCREHLPEIQGGPPVGPPPPRPAPHLPA